MVDVAVVGLGPAGRALASRCLVRGLDVLAIDPRPERTWTPTYGIWDDERAWLPETVVRSRIASPEVRASTTHRLGRAYTLLDNSELQTAMSLDGATIVRERLDDAAVSALRRRAAVVVDARGARPVGQPASDRVPAQTAYGVVVDAADAEPALQGAEALLMDWTPDWSTQSSPRAPATFLYAMPLGDGTVLLEETCLAAEPALGVEELKRRLHTRLGHRGVDEQAVTHPRAREVVYIPMRGRAARPPAGVLALGTAGRGGHPVTGYSVAHTVTQAETWAQTFARGDRPRSLDPHRPVDLLHSAGLRALLRLDAHDTISLFEGFGRLTPGLQRAFLTRGAPARQVAAAMWQMFEVMSPSAKLALAKATLRPW